MSLYKNKTAFITGGSTGIGLAIAKALAKEGSHIVLFARTVSKLETALNDLKLVLQNPSQKINYYSVDIVENTEVEIIFEKAIQENGIPDFLINCVGIAQPDYFENITFENYKK